MIEGRDAWRDEKLLQQRELADIKTSILRLYIHVVCQKTMSLFLFECKNFIDVLFELIKKYVFAEGTYVVEFVNEVLHAYFFEKSEETDPLDLYDRATGQILLIRNV